MRILALVGVLALLGCGPRSVAVSQASQAATSDAIMALSVADLSRDSVSAGALEVTGMTVTLGRMGRARVQHLEFVPVAAADYVEVQICGTREAVCTALGRSVVNRVVLPSLGAGTALAAARACVNAERALEPGENCGPWNHAEFTLLEKQDATLKTLLDEREAKRAQLLGWGKRLEQALAEFQADSAECLKRAEIAERVSLLRGIVANVLVLGEDLIQKSVDTHDPAPLAADIPAARVAEPIKDYEARLARFREFDQAVRHLAESRRLFEKSMPVPAVQVLGDAVFDLFTARSSTPGICLAQERAEREVGTIQAAVATLHQRISIIDSLLEEGDTP